MTSFADLFGAELLDTDGKTVVATADKLKDRVTAVYFSAHWCPPCRGFTPKLAETYTAYKEKGLNFEVVFVSSDCDEQAFDEYFQEQPWLALPYADRERKDKLSKKFKVRGIPTLVILDADTKGAKVPVADLASKHLLLYFSAHWCPPCRGFTPKLAEAYKAYKEKGLDLEVVFVSSDRDEKSFAEYFGEMPWLALPFAERDRKSALSKAFDVEGIPTLVILDKDGS